jgi:hypothetical protein
MSNRVKTPISPVFSLLNSRGARRIFGAAVTGVFGTMFFADMAAAQTCSAYTYTFMNGTTADATQVNNDFSHILGCANTLASGGTLTNATLSGTTTLPGSGVITSTGSVGIGTTTPSAKLHVNTNSSNGVVVEEEVIDGQTQNLFISGSGQTIAVKAGSNYYGAVGGYGNGTLAGMGLWGGTGSGAPQLYLTSAGNVGIGTTSPGYTLHVNGSVAGTSAYNNLSDARLKKSIVPIENALATIEKLQGIHFRWRTVGEREVGKTLTLPIDEPQIGFIAQRVREVLPEAVTVSGSEHLVSMAESKVVPVLVEAVKELKAYDDQVAKENKVLKSRFDDNERRLSELESRAGIRSATNVTLLTRFAAAFGW